MATSGSYTFTENRNSLIKDAYIAIGQIDHDEAMNASIVQLASRRLNRIIQELHTDEIRLWKRQDSTLFLEKNKSKYALGPSGDNWTTSWGSTEVKVAASENDTSIDVDDTSSMSVSDNIGIEVDDGTVHWTTISTIPDSDSITIATGLDDSAAVDNKVFFYTTKAQKPRRILGITRKDSSNNETPVVMESKHFYWQFANKSVDGPVTTVVFDPTLINASLYVWPETDDATDKLEMYVEYPIEVFEDLDDDVDLPPEAYNMLIYLLAKDLGTDFKVDEATYIRVARRARDAKKAFDDWDQEHASMYFQPEVEY